MVMADVSSGPGWWLASDGKWYPPHLHPRVRAGPERAQQPVASVAAVPGGSGRSAPPWEPVTGSSSVRQTPGEGAWTGPRADESEYLVWTMLRHGLSGGEMILSDRRVPGGEGYVDLIVVAPTGVWVIDATKWASVSYGSKGTMAPRLYAGKQDVTPTVEKLYSYVIPVAGIVGDPSVPIHPAMAILVEQCDMWTGLRFRLGRPIRHERVWICPPALLLDEIRKPGPLSQRQIVHIGHRLDEALPPR